MNYYQLMKELDIMSKGLTTEQLKEINIIDWINDNLKSEYTCIACGKYMPDDEQGYCYECNEKSHAVLSVDENLVYCDDCGATVEKKDAIEVTSGQLICSACETKRTIKQ